MTELKLSIREQKLYDRVRKGRYYKAYSNRTPKTMAKLQDKGLVGIAGRSPLIEAYFVPHGYENRQEILPFNAPEELVIIGDFATIDVISLKLGWDVKLMGVVVEINPDNNVYKIATPDGIFEGHSPVIYNLPVPPEMIEFKMAVKKFFGFNTPSKAAKAVSEDDLIGMSGYASKADRDKDIADLNEMLNR